MPSKITLKGKRELKKNSKRRSKKNSNEDEDEMFQDMEFNQKSFNQKSFQSQVMPPQFNGLQNPNNIDFDPLSVNYVIPPFDNNSINNYGISYNQLTSGPQPNGMYNAFNNKSQNIGPPMMDQTMGPQMMGPQMMGPQMGQQMGPQMAPQMMASQMMEPQMGQQMASQMMAPQMMGQFGGNTIDKNQQLINKLQERLNYLKIMSNKK